MTFGKTHIVTFPLNQKRSRVSFIHVLSRVPRESCRQCFRVCGGDPTPVCRSSMSLPPCRCVRGQEQQPQHLVSFLSRLRPRVWDRFSQLHQTGRNSLLFPVSECSGSGAYTASEDSAALVKGPPPSASEADAWQTGSPSLSWPPCCRTRDVAPGTRSARRGPCRHRGLPLSPRTWWGRSPTCPAHDFTLQLSESFFLRTAEKQALLYGPLGASLNR